MKTENPHPCPECDGDGKVYYSCCGDDVKGTIHEDNGICQTCKEHLSGEYEDCESCGGTGEVGGQRLAYIRGTP